MDEFGFLQGYVIVPRVKQSIWKDFKSMEPYLESFGLWLENWIWKVKKRR